MSLKTQCSLQPLVFHFDVSRPCRWDKIFSRKAPLVVEIGFGLGEVLLQQSADFPDMNFVGIETNWERIYKTLKHLYRNGAGGHDNVRIVRLDAITVFERMFQEKSIDRIYCLFPCPWPKKKHTKYRLFSKESLCLMNSRLKDNGHIKIVTDYFPYVQWIEEETAGTGFALNRQDVSARYGTKFEKKWRREGQETFFEISLKKRKHIPILVKRDAAMKNYSLPSFNPAKFKLEKYQDDVTVIPRNTLFDRAKNVVLVHTLVAEQNLTQDFWVSISKQKKGWLIKRAEGHHFFPTPGVARALKLVYETAKESGK